jgi:hypothetical protein
VPDEQLGERCDHGWPSRDAVLLDAYLALQQRVGPTTPPAAPHPTADRR